MSLDHMSMNEDSGDGLDADGEGVWAPHIENVFQEALRLFPPCGRRKHIIQEEGAGKMYGRNELIAMHIEKRTGKKRTRKQVSSHIQVLARRKAKVDVTPNSANGSVDGSTGAGSVGSSSSTSRSPTLSQGAPTTELIQSSNHMKGNATNGKAAYNTMNYHDSWADRPIVTSKIRLVSFSAFSQSYRRPESGLAIGLSGNNPLDNNLAVDNCSMTLSNHQPLTPLMNGHQSSFSNNLNQTHEQSHNTQASDSFNFFGGHRQTHSIHNESNHNNVLKRHNYIYIDYSQSMGRQIFNNLECIDITQIEDKFPGIGNLYRKGSPDSFFLVKFWADWNHDYEFNLDDQDSFFGFSNHFETLAPYTDITCSSKACSFGMQVVEKVEKIYGTYNSTNGRYSYAIDRSVMCEFMIKFRQKLRQLPKIEQMNSVLENFTIFQVITSESVDCSPQILLCLAYVFEIAPIGHSNGPQHHVYQLT